MSTTKTDEHPRPPLADAIGSVKKPTMPTDMLRMVCQVEDTEDNRKSLIACVEAIRRIPFPGAQGFSVLKVEQVRPTLMAKMVTMPSRPEMAIKDGFTGEEGGSSPVQAGGTPQESPNTKLRHEG